MTSFMAASNASLLAKETEEVPEKEKCNDDNNKNNEAAAIGSTFNPITDGTQTKVQACTPTPPTTAETSIAATTTTSTTPNSTSKIPHPLAVAPLATKTSPLQRAASLRLRGTKSNSPSNTFQPADRMETEHVNKAHTTHTELNEKTKQPGTHDMSAGRSSARRKLALNSQYSTCGLTRSSSLRRNYNPGHKTDAHKESCTAASAGIYLKSLQLKDSSTNTNGGAGGHVANDLQGKSQNAMMDELDAEAVYQDVRKSLPVNAATSATPTTPKSAAAPVRPLTLATTTPAGNGIATSSSVATTPKTLKTPTTALTPQQLQQQQQHQQQHQHTPFSHGKHPHPLPHPHHHCTKQGYCTQLPTKLSPRTPPVTPDSPCTYLEDDLDSMYSFATTTSGRSTMSCEHAYVARNGTTFSGRKMKYVVHCSNYAGQVGPDYLTPTQRAQRQIRRLKELLCVARQDLEQKDSEILRLTREVVELRLFKASLSSPEERSASSDAVTVREAELKTSQDVSPIVDMVDDVTKSSPRHIVGGAHHQHLQHQHNAMQLSTEMQSSFADSGHFEDMTSSSVHSKDSYSGHTQDIACGSDEAAGGDACSAENYELQRQELIRLYEQRIEELIRSQDTATSEIKRSHNDKVEALLQKLAECNTRYADIVPDYEHAKERIRELEKQLEDLQRKLTEHEEKQNKMYLHMYQKGQEAERIARADQALELAHRAPNNKVSINELLHQLQSTQDELENIRTIYRRLLDAQKNRTRVDPEVTLEFLKSAVYYFLTDKENSQGHLQAIESILEFSEAEKQNITKARSPY